MDGRRSNSYQRYYSAPVIAPKRIALETTDLTPSQNVFLHRLMIVTFSLGTFVLFVTILEKFATILQPLLLAQLLTYLIAPVANWLHRRGLNTILTYFVLVGGVGLFLFGLGELFAMSVRDFQQQLPKYEAKMEAFAHRVTEMVPELAGTVESVENRERKMVTQVTDTIQRALGSAPGLMAFFFFVLINLIFLTTEQVGFHHRVRHWFAGPRADQIMGAMADITESIGHYLGVKTLMSLLTGFLTFLVTFLFGIDFALLWGVLAFLFNYIPYVGSFVSVTPPILLSLMQNESIGTTLALIIVLLIVHQGTGTFIETYMMGSKLNLSPLVIIMALAFWGQVWGIIGMILAVPLMVVLKTFLGSITETKFLASLLSTPETKHPPSAML